MNINAKPMSNLQLEILKLFSRKVSENDLREIKKLISNYFAEKAISEADKIWFEKGLTDLDAEKLSHTHLRTTYKNQFE